MEIGMWDDAGAGETIQFNYYPTTSTINPTYSVTVPKKSGTIALTSDLASYNPTTNFKTINNQSIIGTGNINIEGGGGGGAYYDAEGKDAVETAAIAHTGVINYENGTASNGSMKLYVDWMEGEWYHIYNVEQFLDNASVGGSYVIHADLDFEGEIWPSSLMYGNFTGTIQGNGHTFKNISIEQTNNSKVNAGLFGRLAEGSCITDLKLENVNFTIKAGTRVAGTAYGLFAGAISNDTRIENVTIANGTLQIDSRCYFGVDDYAIGLLCGMGSADIDTSGITCVGSGDNAESVVITVVDDVVTVEFVTA